LERKFLKPLIEKQQAEDEKRRAEARAEAEKRRAKAVAEGRAEGIKAGRAEGMAAGRAAGRTEERLKWTDWNRRRVEAEKKGEPFNEPPPSP
jgi:flagellar biosynthesis/type III secretory pathway protein FliH